MDEGEICDVPAEVVLRVIASGSNSGSTATLEDMLRVEYERDADANLMVDIDNVDLSLKQRFKLLNEGILPFQPLHLNREMKGLKSNFLRAINKEPLQLLHWQGT